MTTASELAAKIIVGDEDLTRLNSAVNDPPGTFTTDEGVVVANLRKRLQDVGYLPPVAFAAGLTPQDGSFTVVYDNLHYAADPNDTPFTTTGTFDPSQWVLLKEAPVQADADGFNWFLGVTVTGGVAPVGGVNYVNDPSATGLDSSAAAFGIDGIREAGPNYTTREQAVLAINAGDIVDGDTFTAEGVLLHKTSATEINNVFDDLLPNSGVGFRNPGTPFFVNANTWAEVIAANRAFKIHKFAQGDVITIPDAMKNGSEFTVFFFCDNSDYEEGFVDIDAKGVFRNEFHQISYRDSDGAETIPIRKGETLTFFWSTPSDRYLVTNHNYDLWSGSVGATKWRETVHGEIELDGVIGHIAPNTDVLVTLPSFLTFAGNNRDLTLANTNYGIFYSIRSGAANGAATTKIETITTITRNGTLNLLREFAAANPNDTNTATNVRWFIRGAELDYTSVYP